MRAVPALFVLFALAVPALAETPLTPEEFEAEVTGRTLTYGTAEGPYGIERYLPDRRVTWGFLNGECYDGEWFVQDQAICFVYDGIDVVQCWQFWRDGEGLRAEYLGPDGGFLFEVAEDGLPLVCGGVGA
jgi:hypothetical protein